MRPAVAHAGSEGYNSGMTALKAATTLDRTGKTHLARLVFFAFLLTFMVSRIIVFLIMTRHIPDLFLYLGGTHIHHLNYGIFLLAGLGAYFLFARPEGRNLERAAALYGIGMAFTFDEFGMWLRLGGSYWQQASLDAVGVVGAFLGLIAYAPTLKRFQPRHWWSALVLVVLATAFFVLLNDSFKHARKVVGPKLYELESKSPR